MRTLEEKIAAYWEKRARRILEVKRVEPRRVRRRKVRKCVAKKKPVKLHVVESMFCQWNKRYMEEELPVQEEVKPRALPWSKKGRMDGDEVTRRVEAAMRERLAAGGGERKRSAAELERERFRAVAGKFALSDEEERLRLEQIARRLDGA